MSTSLEYLCDGCRSDPPGREAGNAVSVCWASGDCTSQRQDEASAVTLGMFLTRCTHSLLPAQWVRLARSSQQDGRGGLWLSGLSAPREDSPEATLGQVLHAQKCLLPRWIPTDTTATTPRVQARATIHWFQGSICALPPTATSSLPELARGKKSRASKKILHLQTLRRDQTVW